MTQEQIEYSNQKFAEIKDRQVKIVENVKRIIPVNRYLENFNWVIFNPYLPGGLLSHFEQLQQSGKGNKESIFKVFANSFFDLKQTSFFIDGYFKKRPFIEPFCPIIDQSVFMCLQKDYAGAITALIPIIEGSIRIYLSNRNGGKKIVTVKQKQLIDVFNDVEADFRKAITQHLNTEYSPANTKGLCFNASQIEELVNYRCEFFNVWVTPLKKYLDKNFFFEFNKGPIKDKLSRNVILHGYNSDMYYNLENYLKIFNCIVYISYIFGMPDPNSNTLIELNVSDIVYKWKAFEKIRAISNMMTDIKSSVYEEYSTFNVVEFREQFTVNKLEEIFSQVSAHEIESKLKSIDFFFDQFVLNNT